MFVLPFTGFFPVHHGRSERGVQGSTLDPFLFLSYLFPLSVSRGRLSTTIHSFL